MSKERYVVSTMRPGIYMDDVWKFRDYVLPGDKLTCYVGAPTEKKPEGEIEEEHECTVIQKYPYIALTSKGCFSWAMLTIWNQSILRKARR